MNVLIIPIHFNDAPYAIARKSSLPSCFPSHYNISHAFVIYKFLIIPIAVTDIQGEVAGIAIVDSIDIERACIAFACRGCEPLAVSCPRWRCQPVACTKLDFIDIIPSRRFETYQIGCNRLCRTAGGNIGGAILNF